MPLLLFSKGSDGEGDGGREVNSQLSRNAKPRILGFFRGMLRLRIWSNPTRRLRVWRDGGLERMLLNE